MSQAGLLRGVVPIVPTPFRSDESIDLEGIAACIEFAVQCRVCAVCLPAYGSEFYKLTEAERRLVVETAIKRSAGRVQVIAQSNHPSARCAAELAKRHEDLGADLISFAIPRLFSLPAADLLDYCRTVCQAVQRPLLIQDFNPGGPTVGAEFARALHDECPNFRYLKLEEPLMAGKVRAIREATQDQIGVLEGWGGMSSGSGNSAPPDKWTRPSICLSTCSRSSCFPYRAWNCFSVWRSGCWRCAVC
jgi:4-hydroxy-tetrahydrodipicolinate synthase